MDESKRRDKLDDAMLYVMGSVGILFGIIQLYVGSLTVLVIVIPVAILGWILPFWFGYIRGAMRDSMPERYRGWVVLVVGLGLYAVIVSEEEAVSHLPDQRYVAFLTIPFVIAVWFGWKNLPRFRKFVLGPGFQSNPVVSESAMNLVWAALTISFPSSLLAIAYFLNVWDIPFCVPFTVVAYIFIRKSNYFANRVSWNYKKIPANGRLHHNKTARDAFKILRILFVVVGITTSTTLALSELGYGSLLASLVFYSAFGWLILLFVPYTILRFLLRTGHRFVFIDPTVTD